MAACRDDLLTAESRRPQGGAVLKAQAKPERAATKKGRCS
jgi:hypothetical protein